MTPRIAFMNRKFSPIPAPIGVKFEVDDYSHHAQGGPYQCGLKATGGRDDVFGLLNMCRYPVTISNEAGSPVWWGMIKKVEVRYKNLTATADLDGMHNRVAVAYTLVGVGESTTGIRGTTAWAEDAVSIAEFGRRDLLDSLANTTLTLAGARRDKVLEEQKYPAGRLQIEPIKHDLAEDKATATLECCGWWQTMEWEYAVVPTKLALSFQTIGTINQELGLDHIDDQYNIKAVAQSFDVPVAFNLFEFEIYIRKVGGPTEDVDIALYSNPDDLTPTTELATATIAASDISTSYGWVRATLSASYALTAGSTYFLVVSTDQMNSSNYYQLAVDGNQGYGAGVIRQQKWDGGDWGKGPNADMPFRLYDNVLMETTIQLQNYIFSFGQFLKRVFIDKASGITSESYRNGDNDALEEAEKLLEAGTTNKRRLLAWVYPNRTVKIYEEPADTDVKYFIDSAGQMWYGGGKVDMSTCPCGIWCSPLDVVPSIVNATQLSGLGKFFINEAQYSPTRGYSFTPRGTADIYQVGPEAG